MILIIFILFKLFNEALCPMNGDTPIREHSHKDKTVSSSYKGAQPEELGVMLPSREALDLNHSIKKPQTITEPPELPHYKGHSFRSVPLHTLISVQYSERCLN